LFVHLTARAPRAIAVVLVTDLGISHLVNLTADEARAAARALRAYEILKGSQAKL